jgi:hypothetical protein
LASSQHVTYKLKDVHFLTVSNEILYNSKKGELELLNIKTLLQIPAPFIIFQMDIHSYNRLESSSLSCHEQVISI